MHSMVALRLTFIVKLRPSQQIGIAIGTDSTKMANIRYLSFGVGVLKNKFKKPFRRQPLWSVDWSDYEPLEGGNTSVSALGAMSKVGKQQKDEQTELSKKHDKEAD